MNTRTDTIDYEGNQRNARQLRAEEIGRIFGNIVAFFRARRQPRVEKAFRPVAIGKHSMRPSA